MLRAGHGLVLAVVALLAVGVVMVCSAGLEVGGAAPLGLGAVLGGRDGRFALAALLLLVVGAQVPVRRLATARLALPAALLCLVVVSLVWVPGIGQERNFAARWVRLGPVTFQASELAKWTMPLVLAWWIASRGDRMRRIEWGFLVPGLWLGLLAALIAIEDLGTATLVATVGGLLLLAGGARLLHLALAIPPAIAAFALFALGSDYRMARLRAFRDPFADPEGIGYHVVQSLAAIAGGGVGGRGLGGGFVKFEYLPEDTTDFIFSVICEELGLFGAVLVTSLYGLALFCAMRIVLDARDRFARLLGLGIFATIGIQALVNLLVVTGLAPTKGIALPLISHGGTGWCLTGLALGLLLAIERDSRTDTEPAPLPALPGTAAA